MAKNILIFTGNGKGKSTAAFGMTLRARGHNQRVFIIQFMKKDSAIGELVSLKKLGVEVEQCGLGFVPRPDNPKYAEHRAAAQRGFERVRQILAAGTYDLVILDEACGALAHGLLDEEPLLQALNDAKEPVNIVLTGRNASIGLRRIADTVSEIVHVKHALDEGTAARKGIEF